MATAKTNPQHYRDIAGAIRTRLGTSTAYRPEDMAAAISGIEGAAVGGIDPDKASDALPGSSKVLTDGGHYTAIAAAIRAKNGTSTTYRPSEMAAAILGISASSERTVTVRNNTGATIDTSYASGGSTMQNGEKLTVTFTSRTAGTLFQAPVATMGGAAFDLAPYLTTGLTVAVDGVTYFKTFTLTDVPVTGDLVLDLLGSAVNRYLFSPSVENGTVPAPGASGGAVYRAQNGSCRLTFIPDAGYGLNPPEGVTESTYISQPWNYSYMTFTDANTGEALDFSTLYKSRNTLSHNADGNYYLQLGACIAYDVVYHIAFEQMPT